MIAPDNNYTIFRKDRQSKGGGVCMVLKNVENFSFCDILIPTKYSISEILATDIISNGKPMLRIIVLYSPSNMHNDSNYVQSFHGCLEFLMKCAQSCLILGNINLQCKMVQLYLQLW